MGDIIELAKYRIAHETLDSLQPIEVYEFPRYKPSDRTHYLRMHPFHSAKLASRPAPIQTPDSLADLLYFPS
jgi:hypothetical protein